MSARWQQVKEVLQWALERPPDERGRFLDKVCADDSSLRREVEVLLASSENIGSFMEQAAIGKVAEMFVSAENNLQIGESFNHYEIIRQIGAGGMGEVYLANDTKLERRVAVKILNEKFAAHESNLQRFVREAKAASALNHPNILTIYEIGESENAHYIVSEYVEGATLRETLKQKTLTLAETLDIAIQIANALTAAHSAKIVHRDIKPENIIVRPDGLAKILDFGLAKLVEQKPIGADASTIKQNQTAQGLILGTINYMSPEQAKGEKIDERTDIFSFGVCLYEMLAGRTPFAGDSSSETLANLMNKEPMPVARYVSDAPDELPRIVAKTLRKNRDERYQTMKGLLADLKELRENLAFSEKLEKSHSPETENETRQFPATNQGEKTRFVGGKDSVRPLTTRKLVPVSALLVLLAAIGFGVWYFSNRADSRQIESIAVLPFQNDSGNADVEYLSDGMTETLIGGLSQIPKLNVKARSSVFRYKGQDIGIKQIGEQLNVQAILTGRVVQRGDDLTLYLSLVDAAKETNLWSKQYNRKLTNLVALQTEIARDVSDNLKTKLSGADEKKLAKNYTENAEAYRLYLQGRYFWNKRTDRDIRKSIEYYEKAIALDPEYALAYAGLADAYVLFPVYSIGEPQDSYPKTKAAALKALEIDETLAEAHAALAVAIFLYDWNLPESDKEFRRAIELNPNYATARQWYGSSTLTVMKRFDEAVVEIKRAQELDPLSSAIKVELGYTYVYARQYDKAIEQLQKTIEMDQNFEIAHAALGVAYAAKKFFPKAIAEYEKARQSGDDPYFIALLGHAYGASGRHGEALKTIERMREISKRRYVSAYNFAIVYAALGDKDKAFAEFEKSYQDRANEMIFIGLEPLLDPLRDDPRFQDLVRRVGLPQ